MTNKTSLEHLNPEIAQEWHPTKNGTTLLSDVKPKSNMKVWWLGVCGHEWDSKVYSRVSHPKCPVCMFKRVQPGANDLGTLAPELALEWSDRNDKKPTEVTPRTKKKAWWLGACGHEWEAPVFRRADGAGCPFCVKHGAKALQGVTDLLTLRPDVAAEWSSRNSKSPAEVTVSSSYTAEWECREGHSWGATVYARTRGQGCPQCSGRKVTLGVNDLLTVAQDVAEEWSARNEKAVQGVHSGSKCSAWWRCNAGHEWEAPVYARVRGTQCPKCGNKGTSKAEQTLLEFVQGLTETRERDRKILGGRELDIVCDKEKVAIEFNGLYWHSEAQVSADLHLVKSVGAERAGYQLLHIWEDDWRDRRPIVERMIARKLGKSTEPRYNARSLEFREVSSGEARVFLEANHIQGFAGGSWRGGLYSEGRLVALTTFKNRANGEWELVRFATSGVVRGGHSKILKRFIESVNPERIVTFSDRGVSDGGLYSSQGFVRDGELKPDYSYLVGNSREHKFRYRKARFEKDDALKYQEGLTETELAQMNKLLRVYDAGKTRWVWYNGR